MADPDPHKVAQLKAALEHFQPGRLFDREEEQTLAPVRTRALRLLDQRARSKSELRSRLISAEFDPELVERVLDSLENSGLVNDAVFASEWVRQRSQRRGKSARALDMELLDKGVAEPVRQEALSQITAEDEEAAARAVAEKKAREVKAAPSDRAEYDKHLRRIVGVMARRGYSSALSLRLGREVLDARIAECE
ncbi:recombination regulator RecX [Corynebacterium sanguinis]|uniref:recombination regulator RecX n=1 Tax=Corynebacterium sanguinis TaxID=2594913 RepID=UPI00223B1ED0|nr:recombination regulator RecX [Corynebacterium sanguinis]MCT1464577.1 recombination regulator RecX [Corynebacterium sanguinis]MCT1555366.1 recombination regulator RecX [Corynebacterium sanguinis]MCT1663823.1 recombination regulator RecX [Corynebacterium sanguinis]MCT2022552.1 recombination regulator RecX [Corynebacterium sanguinis]MCT2047364.1 recombination regulator RecX [Corynebacterium sanguinis]